MKTKNLMVSICTLVFALFLVATVAATDLVNDDYEITVDGILVVENGNVTNIASVIAGEMITVKVYFTANMSDTDVTVEAEIEGEKVKTSAITNVFDVEAGKTYKKVLTIEVPFELRDDLSDFVTLEIEVDGKDHKSVLEEITLRVQRPSYNPVVKSITTPSSIDAGETFPVEIVLKNMGYNELEDIYVSANIVGLNAFQGPKWFGDLVAIENCSNDCDLEDTVVGKLYLEVPYNTVEGTYTLEVIVVNDDVETTELRQIVINNDFSENVVSVNTEKTVAKSEEAVYDLLIVNPTNKVKVYRIVSESTYGVSSAPVETVIAVPAGSSKTVKVVASSDEEGTYTFNVNILSGDELVKTVTFGLEVEGKQTNSIVVLTIVLAIIFLVLLVVLIVLLGRKPEKSEEFGESYY
jgi:hypothetical protein